MVGSFKHFHEESVNRCVADQLEEEQVLQALQADGAQCWESEQQLSEPASWRNERRALASSGEDFEEDDRLTHLPCCSGYLCLQ